MGNSDRGLFDKRLYEGHQHNSRRRTTETFKDEISLASRLLCPPCHLAGFVNTQRLCKASFSTRGLATRTDRRYGLFLHIINNCA